MTLLRSQRHAGEAAMLVMADEQGVEAVLVNDLRARNLATVMGTAGILLLAHARGLRVDVQLTLVRCAVEGFAWLTRYIRRFYNAFMMKPDSLGKSGPRRDKVSESIS